MKVKMQRLIVSCMTGCLLLSSACVHTDKDLSKSGFEYTCPDLGGEANFEWNKVSLTISLPSSNSTELKATYAPLKYNKRMIISFTNDDIPVTSYSKGWTTINKKWVDNGNNHHMGMPVTTGKVPDRTLGYTDGCGTEIRFPLGISIWAGNDFLSKLAPGKGDKHLIWKELVPIIDFGGDAYFHDVNEDKFNIKTADGIKAGFDYDQQQIMTRLNRKMKTLVVPNGNKDYYKAALTYDPIVIISDQGGANTIYPQKAPIELHKMYMNRQNFDNEAQLNENFQQIVRAYDSDSPQWFQFFTHGVGPAMMTMLRNINDKYGKDGTDNIWFATIDEVYEYYHFKENYPIVQKKEGNSTTFNIDAKPDIRLPEECTYHRDFTLLIEGIETMDGVNLKVGSNVYGYTYTFNKESKKLMVNLNCNKSLLERAERYANIYVQSPSEDTKADAMYFISQLSVERRKGLLDKIK